MCIPHSNSCIFSDNVDCVLIITASYMKHPQLVDRWFVWLGIIAETTLIL